MRRLLIFLAALTLTGCAYTQHETITEYPNGSRVTRRSTYIVAAPVWPPTAPAEGFSGLQPQRQLTRAEVTY